MITVRHNFLKQKEEIDLFFNFLDEIINHDARLIIDPPANTIKTINQYLFSGCVGLTSVFIPNSVTSIGNRAFDGCSSLKKRVLLEDYKQFHSC